MPRKPKPTLNRIRPTAPTWPKTRASTRRAPTQIRNCRPPQMTATLRSPSAVSHAKRLVVKVGSSLVTNEGKGIDVTAVEQWASQIAQLPSQDRQSVLGSSGVIADGVALLGW